MTQRRAPDGNGPGARPVRVAILDHTAELGGAELALVRALACVDPSRVEAVVVLFSTGALEGRLAAHGHEVVVVPLDPELRDASRRTVPRVRLLPRLFGFCRELVTTLRQLDVDVVHTTSLKSDLAGVLAARLIGRPLVWHVHDRIDTDYLPALAVRLLRMLARRAPRAVVANSAATARTLPGARSLTVVYPGLGTEQLAPAPRSTQPPGPPVVGMVGRISPTKDQLLFVRAARRIADRRPEVRFRIVGAPAFDAAAYEAQVRSEIERLGLAEHVTLVGFVQDPRVELDALAVCVHCASVPEPFGQVVTEAMAWGVPTVATAGGGVDEIVRTDPGRASGLLVPPGDDALLAQAVLEALDHPDEALARAARAHADVSERFLAFQSAEALTRVWEGAASATGLPARGK